MSGDDFEDGQDEGQSDSGESADVLTEVDARAGGEVRQEV